MITPRRTRLVRVPDLHAFRRAIVVLSSEHGHPFRDHAVVVPTRSAARQLERSIASATRLPGSGAGPPHLVTRDQLYDQLHARLARPPRRLNIWERDAIAHRAAEAAACQVADLSFRIRPGLIGELLRFYDHLRRQSQSVTRFQQLMEQALGGDRRLDRGLDRMLRQTSFLALSLNEYERLVLATGACDEHMLRERLIAEPSIEPIRHVIVAVADWIADPAGLFVADYDLLSRISGLAAIDIVCSERLLEAGFHERVHQWLPGIEEADAAGFTGVAPVIRPRLLTPPHDPTGQLWFTHRDREEELLSVSRIVGQRRDDSSLGRTAVVFKRPLPYLYLAGDSFGADGISYSTSAALPLAAETATAALDVLLEFVETDFTRDAIVALLESPHFRLSTPGQEVSREELYALNRTLSERRYLGDLQRLESLRADLPEEHQARTAIDLALSVGRELVPLRHPAEASEQIRRVLAFVKEHVRSTVDASWAPREERAWAILTELLENLAAAHHAHHDPLWTIHEVATAIRRWIQEETFVADSPQDAEVDLIDDQAARFGEFDDLTLVGLVEHDWPESPRRNIFYPSSLLKALGWPSERDRRRGEEARFVDLLGSASRTVTLSTFSLDDETLVNPSLLLDEIVSARLSSDAAGPSAGQGVTNAPPSGGGDWIDMRRERSSAEAPEFHGSIGAQPVRPWSVSALETYLGCPFKFFAQHVLRLSEEPEDEEVMDPRRQGQFVHSVFESFFHAWQQGGHGTITPDNLEQARAIFEEVVERSLGNQGLSDAEAGLERTRLLGSPAAAGLGEAVMRMEAERPTPVLKRLLEHQFNGNFEIQTASGPRVVALKGKADRIDLLADGTFRLIDYKLGWPPDRTKALQLPIYGLCAEHTLKESGRRWTLGEAAYLAFKGPKRVVPLFATQAAREEVLAKAQQRLADTLDRIERGEFPAAPDDVFRCETCSFTSVCRKDYVDG